MTPQNYKRILPPFGWIGGKRQLAPFLLSLFPKHSHYIEVFGGGLSVLFSKPRSKFETVNDFDSGLINLWRAIKNHPEALADRMNTMWHSREIFYEIKSFKAHKSPIDKASNTLYGIQASFGGKRQHFGRNLKTKALNIWRDFTVISKRLKLVQIENQDFEKLIKDFDGDDSFFYCDPPYYGSDTYYKASEDGFDHKRLANVLAKTKGKWLLSYNDCPEIRELYKRYSIISTPEITYTLSPNSRKSLKEIVIANYDVTNLTHDKL